MSSGDLEGAFDWLLLSILAIRKHGEKQSGTVLALPLINYLELVAKISSTVRSRKLRKLRRHYANIKTKVPRYLAEKEVYVKSMFGETG